MSDINRERLVRMFTDMVKISSESLDEKEFGEYCIAFLRDEIGCEVYEDNAKDVFGGSQSNIVAKYYGNTRKKPLLFAAHLDTVKPGKNIVPVIENDRVKSEGDTVLGTNRALHLSLKHYSTLRRMTLMSRILTLYLRLLRK